MKFYYSCCVQVGHPWKTAGDSSSVETNCPSEGQQQKEITKWAYSNYKAVGFLVEIINRPCIFLFSWGSPGHAGKVFYIFPSASPDLYTVSVPFWVRGLR
jgi:hypothetical protein